MSYERPEARFSDLGNDSGIVRTNGDAKAFRDLSDLSPQQIEYLANSGRVAHIAGPESIFDAGTISPGAHQQYGKNREALLNRVREALGQDATDQQVENAAVLLERTGPYNISG